MRKGRTYRVLLIALAAGLAPLPVWAAAEPAEAVCRLLPHAPELDGVVEGDPAWQDAPACEGFLNLRTGTPPERLTRFHAGYTAEALYLAIVCAEPEPDLIFAAMPDGESFAEEDSVTVFLAPEGDRLLTFSANAGGSRSSTRTLRKWQASAKTGEDHWAVEIMLRWEVLGEAPKADAPWALNVLRFRPVGSLMERSSWSHLEYDVEDVARYGALRFEGMTAELAGSIAQRIKSETLHEEVLLYSRPWAGVFVQEDSTEKRILYNQGAHVAPRLSPDGARILYNSVEGGTPGVWLADRSGTLKERVCDGAQACWSPDGTRIMFVRGGSIIERDLASEEETTLRWEDSLKWAYPLDVPGTRGLCLSSAGGCAFGTGHGSSLAVVIPRLPNCTGARRCSPDGKTVASHCSGRIWLAEGAVRKGRQALLAHIAARAGRQLTLAPGIQASPVWSADGKSLCYAHTHSPLENSWEIHNVSLDDPTTVRVVATKAHPGFDWRGSKVEPIRTMKTLGASLTVEEKNGEVVIENDWTVLRVAAAGASITPKGANGTVAPIDLVAVGRDGQTSSGVQDIRVNYRGAEWCSVDASFVSGDTLVAPLTLKMRRTDPAITALSHGSEAYVALRVPMELVIVPDRLANDLVLRPEDVAGEEPISLPGAPIVLGCVADSEAMLVLTAELRGRLGVSSPMVTRSADGKRLSSLMFDARFGHNFTFTLLARGDLWKRLEPAQGGAKKGWSAQWRPGFPAQWRVSARKGHSTYSHLWNAGALNALGAAPVPLGKRFAEAPDIAVAYVLERGPRTPLDVLTPVDIDVGVYGWGCALDHLGLRNVREYRTGTDGFRDLIFHDLNWDPARAGLVQGEYGVLETMGSVFPVDSDNVRSLITHLGEDALNLLRGLDDRIGEYEQFFAALPQNPALPKENGEHAAALCAKIKEAPRTDVAAAQEKLKAVLGVVGTRDAVTLEMLQAFANQPGNEEWRVRMEEFWGYLAAREGRIWHNGTVRVDLWYEDAFQAFAGRCVRILKERQAILTECREGVKQMRDALAWQALERPESKEMLALRQKTGEVLSNRYYLEGDWRGEEPVGKGATR